MAKYLDLPGLTAYDAKIKAYADAVAAAAAAGKITMQAVNTLPAVVDASQNVIYLVPNSGSGNNVKDEYILVNGAFEKIGTTEIDISCKIDKVSSPTTGNFAKLKSDGSIEDAGVSASSFATAAQGALAATALQPADMIPITYSGAGNEIDALFVTTATLTIDTDTITYEVGMTWARWVASAYNTIGASVNNDEIMSTDEKYLYDGTLTSIANETIDSTKSYSWLLNPVGGSNE